MKIKFKKGKRTYQANLAKPIDISIPLEAGDKTVNCFYAPMMETSPVIAGDFIGSTQQGGIVNFLNVKVNPHGNGTHTECVGHIAKEKFTINNALQKFHFLAKVITVTATITDEGDHVIFKNQIQSSLKKREAEAIVIRTFPNHTDKLKRHYSGTNPTYLHHEATEYLVRCGVKHLLIDLPSVDREEDGGALLSHRAFWQYPHDIRKDCTITELIFVNDKIKDGLYLLQIGIASLEIDVSPSKPILYKIKEID